MNTTYKILTACVVILCINIISARAEFIRTEANNASGEIDHNVFYLSVPEKMTIGKSYAVKIFIKNTGSERNNFRVMLSTTGLTDPYAAETGKVYSEFIYPRYDSSVITLKAGESRRLEFKITPVKPYTGDIPVSANLYVIKPKQLSRSDFLLLDHAQKRVRIIEPAFTKDELISIFNIIVLIIIILCIKLIYKKRYQT